MNIQQQGAAAVLAMAMLQPLAANAADVQLTLSPSGPGSRSASFEQDAFGLFVDTFTFTPSALSGDVSVTLTPLSTAINFQSALLNGQGFSFLPEQGQTSFDFMASVDVGMPLTLTVLGFAGDADTLTGGNGRYRGNIVADNITAVIPEPGTYALMLAGLAAVGAMRRRKARE